MILSLIAATGQERQLGHKGRIPWHLPEELRYFKRVTMGHHLLMGRKTFQSLPGILPGRPHIILSRSPAKEPLPPPCIAAASLEEALEQAQSRGETELFICGGAEIYRQTLPMAERLYLSRVNYSGPADTYFPPWEHLPWEHSSTISGKSFEGLIYHRKKDKPSP